MKPESNKYVVKYDNTSALFASQTIVNAGSEEVIVDFSSGPVPGQDHAVLPIHTRVAMTKEGAKRLARLLDQATKASNANEARLPGT